MGRVPISSTDFSTRIYSYDDVPNDFQLKHFALVDEDFKYKVSPCNMVRSSARFLFLYIVKIDYSYKQTAKYLCKLQMQRTCSIAIGWQCMWHCSVQFTLHTAVFIARLCNVLHYIAIAFAFALQCAHCNSTSMCNVQCSHTKCKCKCNVHARFASVNAL